MKKKYLLGFDCGTYESKGVICDANGQVLGIAISQHIITSPKPGYAEHDPINDWWYDFKKVTKELFEKTRIDPAEIAGIGISTVMAGIIPVDENCNPLRNAILYGIDTRSQATAEELNRVIGEDKINEVSGSICDVESFGPKIKWIRDNEPEIYAKTRKFTMVSGFLTAKLTGEFYVDEYSLIRAEPILNYKKMEWDDEMCEYICPKEMLPKIAKTTDVIGKVTREAALETGLAEGTPVITGTTDAAAEAVSVGVVEPGDTMLMYGSTSFIIHVSDKLVRDSHLWTGPYVLDGMHIVTAGMATTGSLTRWIRDNFSKDLLQIEEAGGESAYTNLFLEAEAINAGADGLIVLPYFAGERMPLNDPLAKGVIFGLNTKHSRGHLLKAAIEGIGYGIDQNLSLMRNFGCQIKHVKAVGGGTKSRTYIQTVSDICNIHQEVAQVTVGASYGDAILAGIGVGLIKSPQDVKNWIQNRYTTSPNPEHRELYDEYKEYFSQLYLRNKDIMHMLAKDKNKDD